MDIVINIDPMVASACVVGASMVVSAMVSATLAGLFALALAGRK